MNINITYYNCSFVNGTYFNNTEPCDDGNYDYNGILQVVLFMLCTILIIIIIICPPYCRLYCRRNSSNTVVSRTEIVHVEPNYSNFIISLDEQLEKDSICIICFEELDEEEVGKLENCEHIFHKRCIKKWLEENPICPICRTDIY